MSALATDAIEYSVFTSQIDLYAAKDRDILSLDIVTATTGATVTAITKGSKADQRTYHVSQGTRLDLAIRKIISVTNVTVIRANWGDF